MATQASERDTLVHNEGDKEVRSGETGSTAGNERNMNWRPLLLRPTSLVAILIFTFTLFGLLQYAASTVPRGHTRLPFDTIIPGGGNSKRSATIAPRINALIARFEQADVRTVRQSSFTFPSPRPSADDPTVTMHHTAYFGPEYKGKTSETTIAPGTIASTPSAEAYPPSFPAIAADGPADEKKDLVPPGTTSTSASDPPSSAPAPTAYVPANVPARFEAQADEHNDRIPLSFSVRRAVISTYMPVLLAVLSRVLWTNIGAQLILVEPFRQMADRRGAQAERAFFWFYLQQTGLSTTLRALVRGNWTTLCGTGASLLAAILPALASEAIWVDTDYPGCQNRDSNNTNNPCPPRMSHSAPVVRSLQALLLLYVIATIFIAIALDRHKTRLLEDPSSIGAIYRLTRHPHLKAELHEIDHTSSHRTLRRKFAGKRYVLSYWKSPAGRQHYGIGPFARSYEAEEVSRLVSLERGGIEGINNVTKMKKSFRFDARSIVLLFLSSGTFALIMAYYFEAGDTEFNRFFNSNTFGPRFILTLSGTIIAILLKDVQHDAINMAPYARLSQGCATYATTIGFAPTTLPVVSTWRAASSGYIFVTLLTLIMPLAEILNIVVAGVPYAPGQYFAQFQLSTYLSLVILGLIASAAIANSCRKTVKLPVKPFTLAGKMSYVAASHKLTEQKGSRYGLGRAHDGSWVIDEVKPAKTSRQEMMLRSQS